MEALFSIFNFGMVLLILGWSIQLAHSIKGGKAKKEINNYFPFMYGLGALIIAIDGLMNGLLLAPILNLAMVILAGLLIIKMKK